MMKKVLKEQKIVKKICILKTEKIAKKIFNIQTKKRISQKRIMPLCIVVQCKMCAKWSLPILTPGFKNLPEGFTSITPRIKMGEFLQKIQKYVFTLGTNNAYA